MCSFLEEIPLVFLDIDHILCSYEIMLDFSHTTTVQQLFTSSVQQLFNTVCIICSDNGFTTVTILFFVCLSAACVQPCCSSDAVDVVHHSHVVCVQSRNSYSSDPIVHAVHVADRLDELRLSDHRVSRRRHCMGAHHPSIGRSMLDHLLLLLLW